jgi:hypothetical protein
MMRVSIILLMGVACYGCGSPKGKVSPAEGSDVHSLLLANDLKVCTAGEVMKVAFNAADSRYNQALAEGMSALRTDSVSAEGVDKDVHQVICSANAYGKNPYTDDENKFRVMYRVRPSLDKEGSFVAEILAAEEVRRRIATHLDWWVASKRQQYGGQRQLSSEVANPDQSDDQSQSKPCKANVVREVAALEDPDSHLPLGLTEDLSQVRQEGREELRQSICFKGGYCYPTHVNVDGKQIEAINLDSCVFELISSDDNGFLFRPMARPLSK